MYCMTIVFGSSPTPWTMMFKTDEALNSAKSTFQMSPPGSVISLIDDYGQHAVIDRDEVHGVMFEDTNQSRLAHIERALHQDRMNIEANNMRKADPAIAAAMRNQAQAPGVITPFGPNGAFRQ